MISITLRIKATNQIKKQWNSVLLILCFSIYIPVSAQNVVDIPPEIKKEIQSDLAIGEEFEKKSDYNQAAFLYNKSANVYWVYGHLESAIELFEKALDMSERIGNLNGIYVLNTNIGLIHTDLGENEKALANFIKATETARELGRKFDIASSLLNQTNICFETGLLNESLIKLNEAHAIAQELNDIKLLRNAYSLYTKVYDKTGQRDESAKYFELFAAVTRRIQQEEIQRKEEEAKKMVSQVTSKMIEVEAEKQATKKELHERDIELVEKQKYLEQAEQESRERLMQIELLSKERELQQAIISRQKLIQNIYIGIIVTILGFTVLIFYFYHEKRKANALLQQKNNEISRQNTEIQEQAKQLRELNQLKDKLFSIISHDLRSPLGSLYTLLSLTKEGYFTEEGFKSVINELSKNVGYTSELLENLLKWAQSQMQGTKINPNDFNLIEATNNKLEFYAEQAKAKGITLKNLIGDGITVFADRDMIELVLRNLIANAIKFSNNGSTVSVSAIQKIEEVEICVSDTGLGIPPENMEKLFGKEIFTTNGTLHEKGTGLGLILCKDFITINGGKIWAKSTHGKGSKFFFTLPKKNANNGKTILSKNFADSSIQSQTV
jgi:signal transduction histidine kinase